MRPQNRSIIRKILIMKKHLLFSIAFCIMIALTSCHKSGVSLFVGDYTFKTSGEVSIMAEATIDSSDITIPASLNIDLSNDIGQLNISTYDKKNDKVSVVINYLSGDVVVTTGTCNGQDIELDEFRRSILPVSISTLFSSNFYIKVSATGRIYDDNTIVFNMKYNGKAAIGSVTYKIKDKDIKMVAYRN